MGHRVALVVVVVAALAVPAIVWGAGGPSLLRALAGPIASAKKAGRRVLVPSTLAAHAPHLYGSGGASAAGYDLQVASAPGCHDANACFVAGFVAGGGRLGSGSPVSLVGGRTGVFAASRCGASCNPATIAWREYGLRYAIEYIGGRRQMVALADAAIAAGPR
jgi:hypothetical protein